MDRGYEERNRRERERQEALCARLSDVDLGRELVGGWTVAAALAHLAFWDRRTVAALEELARHEAPASWSTSAADWDVVNAGELDRWLAMPPREAIAEALDAARACDSRVEAAPAEVAEGLIAAGRARMLDRSVHRAEHLDQIERALAER
jgi:hypothetical protein